MSGMIGVAISTTGDEHRLGFLETSVQHWWRALSPLGLPTTVFVTVDGDSEAFERVAALCTGFAEVARVGQPGRGGAKIMEVRDGRLGVATNKNTGIELLMGRGVEHLFLSDDDTWPIYSASVTKHIDMDLSHSMVCWGRKRLTGARFGYATWNWPRGVMLYTHSDVIDRVGGMDERFGPGGHEHVEWSRRIHQAGITPAPFITPASYATRNGQGCAALWHCEDMPRPGEPLGNTRARRKHLTSVRRRDGDWEHIESIMRERDGNPEFVPFSAADNGRLSATLYNI